MANINIGTMQSKIYFKDCRVKVIRFKNRMKIDRANKAGFALRHMTWSGPSYLVRTRMKGERLNVIVLEERILSY